MPLPGPRGWLQARRLAVSWQDVWNGFRVRAGLHYGSPEIQFDDVTKGWDYYGTMVNEASRLESLAHGGQILISDAFLRELALELPAQGLTTKCHGRVQLRGCPEMIVVHEVVPEMFSARRFPPLDIDVEDPRRQKRVSGTEGERSEAVPTAFSAAHKRALDDLF